MDATPNTKVSALDRVNVARAAAHIKRSVEDLIAPFNTEYGSSLPDLLNTDHREQLKNVTSAYLEEIKELSVIRSFEVKPIRRQMFKDIYRNPVDRATALMVFWRARHTKEKLHWQEGEHITREQDAEFGHLLEMTLWGMNDELSGYIQLRKPSGYIMDLFITPMVPVKIISLDLEIKDGQVQFP